jgi:iron complex outermembrane receptor protein
MTLTRHGKKNLVPPTVSNFQKMKTICLLILLLSSILVVIAQPKSIGQMGKADVLRLSSEELYRMSLEDIIELSKIAGVSIDELYELVTTSSRTEEAQNEAPNVMHVITGDEIKYRGYKSLREALSNVSGFGVFMKDVQYVAQVRGIAPNDNEKISFMIDGHRINMMSEPDLLNSPINLSNIDRIEIIAGPGSVLYGAESLVATVNMITRKAYKNEVSVTGGLPNEWALNALLGKVWDTDKHITVAFTGMQREGWNAYKVGGVTFDEGNAFNQLARANSTMPQRMYPSFFLTASGQYEGWSLDMSSYTYNTSRIGWAGSISLDEREKLHNQDYFNSIVVRNESNLTKKTAFIFLASFDNKQTIQPNNLSMMENSYKVEAGIHHTTQRNFLQAGIQLGSNRERNNWVYDRQSSSTTMMYPLIMDTNLWTAGVFVSDKFSLSDQFKLVGAIRSDYNTVLANNRFSVSPRVAIFYNPIESFTTKLMFNAATRFPSARASRLNVFDATKPDRVGRMVTKPEQLMTVESQNIYLAGRTKLSLVGYYQYLKDFISWFNPFMNVGDFSGWGLELEWQTKFTSNLSVWANATYNRTDFSQTAPLPTYEDGAERPTSVTVNEKGQMIAVPQLIANVGADICIFNRLYFSPKINYFTGQPAANYNHTHLEPSPTPANPNNKLTVFDFFYVNHQLLLDAALTYKNLFQGMDFRISAQNIMNNQHQMATVFSNQTYTPQGTTLQATLFYSF